MAAVAVLLVGIFFIYIYRHYWLPLLSARWYGIEADAYVSRVEREVRHAGGADYPVQFYYVCFQTLNGLENEARLLNPKKALVPGSRLRIRYLPDRQNTAVLTEILN
ncbi:MAG: hypothetical protein IJQ88_05420 [Clostridia bacterium]|nr:hypothetical protein [Clostridia bacterium]MBQ6721590.1 hypothetical protein [Clostridia bacterium]